MAVSSQEADTLRLGSVSVKLSRRDKVLFPADGITKGELVDYYLAVAPVLLPQVRDRPVSFERRPDGIAGPGFFQQAASEHFPDWIKRARVEKEEGAIEHVLCQDEATLAYLANQAAITLHAWLARADVPQRPDQMLFDLDPPGADFAAARRTALALRTLLDELGLPALVKTTGGRGLHVIVPLVRRQDADTVRAFARSVADVLERRDPKHLTTEVRKNQRHGRLYLDISRNAYAQNAVVPYSVRTRDGAPVATPLAWEELEDEQLRPEHFTLRTVPDRIAEADPWRDPPAPVGSLREPSRRLEAVAAELS